MKFSAWRDMRHVMFGLVLGLTIGWLVWKPVDRPGHEVQVTQKVTQTRDSSGR